MLALLTECRRRWLFGEHAVPIERHTMLGNGRTLALLTPAAKVTWLCHPRPDSPAVFAALLGDDSAGYFSVAPRTGRAADALPLGQRYRHGTMTVETRWSGLTVTDSLHGEEPGDVAGTGALRFGAGAAQLRPAPGVRPGADPARARSATSCGCSAPTTRCGWSPPASSGRSSTTAATTPRTPPSTSPALGGTVTLELRLGRRR